MARTHKHAVIQEARQLEDELAKVEKALADDYAKAQETVGKFINQVSSAASVVDDTTRKVQRAEELRLKLAQAPAKYQRKYADTQDALVRWAGVFAEQAKTDYVAVLEQQKTSDEVAWILNEAYAEYEEREAEAAEKAKAEAEARQRLADEIEAARLRKEKEEAEAEAKRKADEAAHVAAVKATMKRLNAENNLRIAEAKKSGAWEHWQNIALEQRRVAPREAHRKLGRKPLPGEVLEMLGNLIMRAFPSEALIKSEMVGKDEAVSNAYIFTIRELAKWADAQPKNASAVEQPKVEEVPPAEPVVSLTQQAPKAPEEPSEEEDSEGKKAYELKKAKKLAAQKRKDAQREEQRSLSLSKKQESEKHRGGSVVTKGRQNSRGAERHAR